MNRTALLMLSVVLMTTSVRLVAQNEPVTSRRASLLPAPAFTNSIGMEFVLVPSGSFLMGSPEGVGFPDEHPQHKVTISRPFYMSKYPVTVGEYRQFVTATGYLTEGETSGGAWVWSDKNRWEVKADASWKNPYFRQTDRDPVVCVTWNDARSFITWLRKTENRQYQLPSEAEFEYALRAGTETPHFFPGDTSRYVEYGWPQALTKQGFPTHPVGLKKPNPWGLYDLVGNAWQWCEDWYSEAGYAVPPAVDPTGAADGNSKVNRGGMGDDAKYWSSAKRDSLSPSSNYSNQTFRIILRVER